ncbi:nuclear transport factor 2 family protein [Salmonirosea aquatica]|uniref:DUF4440 domain-containing protein n=1 Tax=Salmonirosea aquatica TaxID=2654236 RepID=A0A7C9BHD0_9BACT|nr:DUF4440 domain-containing protein [Cytophagaceae bacterium SJW1-29]
MKKAIRWIIPLAIGLGTLASPAHAQDSKNEVLQVAQDLLDAIGKGDTAAFRSLFLPHAMIYTVREKDGQTVTASRSPFAATFRPGTVVKEEMKDHGVDVRVQGNMAQVWAPYNLWVNGTFSHCGVDVFTLLKTNEGWRIAALSYTIEKEGCEVP